jgi:hypothetical protein
MIEKAYIVDDVRLKVVNYGLYWNVTMDTSAVHIV